MSRCRDAGLLPIRGWPTDLPGAPPHEAAAGEPWRLEPPAELSHLEAAAVHQAGALDGRDEEEVGRKT